MIFYFLSTSFFIKLIVKALKSKNKINKISNKTNGSKKWKSRQIK